MKTISIRLKTLQPVLATSFQGDPNSDVTFGYLPGSMLRGELIRRYLQRPASVSDLLIDDNAQRLFFNGKTRYLNTYLSCPETQIRTLPTPQCWQRNKGEDPPTQIYDLSEYEDIPDNVTPKSISQGFCQINGREVKLFSEKRRINIHNQRDRRKGRATQTSGEVFRYEALEAGQEFQSVILCDREEDADLVLSLLEPEELWLGGSQSAGYGHIKILEKQKVDRWNEVGTELSERLEDRSFLKFTLLSDLILRDALGQSLTCPPTEILNQVLGIDLTFHEAHLGSVYVGGFNRKWGLPLPQVKAISAGSVLVYEMPTNPDSIVDALARLERSGLGERCTEGFGRIAVNWFEECNACNQFSVASTSAKRVDAINLSSETGKAIAKQMADRLLRQKLDALLLEKLGNVNYRIQNPDKISNNQLSRLMIVARRTLAQTDSSGSVSLEPMNQLLNNLTKSSKEKMEAAEIGDRSLLNQLKEWIVNPQVWIEPQPTMKIAGIVSDLTENLAREYTLKLISAVAKQAIKERD
jgi:CRISPR-associated protein Csx10